jgi:hypothetical protein
MIDTSFNNVIMNTKSAIKLARKTPVSRNPNRVDRQLQKLAPKEGEIVSHFVAAAGQR